MEPARACDVRRRAAEEGRAEVRSLLGTKRAEALVTGQLTSNMFVQLADDDDEGDAPRASVGPSSSSNYRTQVHASVLAS